MWSRRSRAGRRESASHLTYLTLKAANLTNTKNHHGNRNRNLGYTWHWHTSPQFRGEIYLESERSPQPSRGHSRDHQMEACLLGRPAHRQGGGALDESLQIT